MAFFAGRASYADDRPQAVEEPAGPAAPPLAGAAGQRPAQSQPLAGAGDADVEQPALLGDLCLGGRVLDRQRRVGEPDEEDGVPFQPLGRMQRRERDALDGRCVLRLGARVEFGDQLRQAGLGKRGGQVVGQAHQRSQ